MILLFYFLTITVFITKADDVVGCGGFVKSNVEINFDFIKVKLYTKQGILRFESECSPTNGYYMVPVYDKGEYYLKVESTLGWTFEPNVVELNIDLKTDKCSLEEDINFIFSGFGIAGKVISLGQPSGPPGVTVSLKCLATNKEISSTVTGEDGSFTFEKILPGSYQIKASHSIWTFIKSESIVTVDKKTGKIDSEILVAGFDASGKILIDGQPIQGVDFILFSKTIKQDDVKQCDKTNLKDAPTIENFKFLCFVTSNNAGKFTFPVLPSGEYSLIPVYRNERIRYDVTPNRVNFVVKQGSHFIQEPFQVSGFVVFGKILNSPKGIGLEGASIFLNEKAVGVTNAEGVYHLEGMKAGSYRIKVEKKRYKFKIIDVKINPSEPALPDIYPTSYRVCCKIILDKLPENSFAAKFIVNFKTTNGISVSKVPGSADRTLCEFLSPQEYIVQVETENSDSRIYLLPSARQIQVVNKPIDDIIFTQMQAKIFGSINCIGSCGNINLFVKYLDDANDEGKSIELSSDDKVLQFTHNVFIGSYKISVINSKWCWVKDHITVDIKNEDVTNVIFQQSGFKITALLSHDALLNIKDASNTKLEDYKAVRGGNIICLPHDGTFKITPNSCHKFEKDVYKLDINSRNSVEININSYLVSIEVSSTVKNSTISATIKNRIDSTEFNLDTFKPVSRTSDGKNSKALYQFEAFFYAKENSQLLITLSSGTLLFEPESKEIVVNTDNCPAVKATFVGLQGIFIEGEVKPAIPDVDIILQLAEPGKSIASLTDSQGKYTLGPLKSNLNYSLTASKLGYRFVQDSADKNKFAAYKLAEIVVEVTNADDAGEKLPGVLISLSGSKFRRNNLTAENGAISFIDLAPGQYFLKPMMKEYKFFPSTKVLDIVEGQVLNVNIDAKRVAFSAYCHVTSLNGEAEPKLVVEANGIGEIATCGQLQEEAKTEADGSARIRGLKPGCEYKIQLKNNSEFDASYERSAPSSKIVQISEDITGIKFIVFRKSTQMDLSGRINTKQEYLETIKVQLFSDANPDDAIQTQTLSLSPFFYFNPIPIDKQGYTIKLKSSMSRRDYEHDFQEISFKADSTIQHFVFNFHPKRKPSNDHELSQASILVLPLTILVLFVGYHYKTVIPFIRKTVKEYFSSTSKSSHASHMPQPPVRQDPSELYTIGELLDSIGKKRKKTIKI